MSVAEEQRAAAFRAEQIAIAAARTARQIALAGSETARAALAAAWAPKLLVLDPLGSQLGEAGQTAGQVGDDVDPLEDGSGPFVTPTN